jgi:hypothetical protein
MIRLTRAGTLMLLAASVALTGCSSCTGFVDSVAAELESRSGRPVTVENRSRHDGARSQDIADQLRDDDQLIKILGDADVVIASFGFNDRPPYQSGPSSCPLVTESDSEQVAFAAAAKTTTECATTPSPRR